MLWFKDEDRNSSFFHAMVKKHVRDPTSTRDVVFQ